MEGTKNEMISCSGGGTRIGHKVLDMAKAEVY